MDLPPEATRRIADDEVAWLTTITDRGAPAPNPVWVALDGEDLVIYAEPSSRKVHNIEKRPAVTLHFNSDPHGGNIVIIAGEASLTHGAKATAVAAYIDKYQAAITGALQMTVDELEARYSTEIRIRPAGVRLTPA